MVLLSVANDIGEIPKRKKLMIFEAMRQNNITVDEALTCIWQAYGDPYLPAGQIEFRHLMKYISKQREQNSQKQELFSYDEAMRICEKETGTLSIDKFFEKQEQPNGGKPLWKRK